MYFRLKMTEIGFFSFITENHGHFIATMEPSQPEQHQRGFVENNCQPKLCQWECCGHRCSNQLQRWKDIFSPKVSLRKFTNILDFATSDEVHQLKDPWGTLTIVVPHLKMEVLTTLGEFIYRGETGKVSNAALKNVLAYIRPKLG